MAATPRASLCPDWVFSNNSNVHVAKNREWFTEYTPFKSVVGTIYGTTGLRIHGVGTVELQTKKSPKATGKHSHRTLRLKNVLHAPAGFCNIIGRPILNDYAVDLRSSSNSKGSISDRDGRKVAYFDLGHRLFSIKLRGPPVGPSVFKAGGEYLMNAFWPPNEQEKWEEYRRQKRNPPYTTEEKKWLKVHYGDEFHFLMANGLNICKDDHREQGRNIVRALMREDEPENARDRKRVRLQDKSESDDDSTEGTDWNGYMAGFDDEQLQWLKKNYGNAESFMISLGLKFFEESDCAEARSILKSFMADDNGN